MPSRASKPGIAGRDGAENPEIGAADTAEAKKKAAKIDLKCMLDLLSSEESD